MLKNAKLGINLALAHYISCLLVGFVLRFYNPKQNNQKNYTKKSQDKNIITRVFNELYEARRRDGRGLGELIGNSVKESVNTLLLIGGFIILFSVLTQVLTLVGFEQTLVLPIISGLFEITNGSHLASQVAAPLSQKVIITSGIIAWSGFSVHAQVATMINGTDLRMKPYIFARILHGLTASIVTYFLFEPLDVISSKLITPVISITNNIQYNIGYLEHFSQMTLALFFLLSFFTSLSLIIYIIKRIKIISFYHYQFYFLYLINFLISFLMFFHIFPFEKTKYRLN